MQLRPMTLHETLNTLEALVKQHAAEQIMPRFNQVTYEFKQDGSLVTEADSAMQQVMIDSLKQYWPDTIVLGEEMTDEEQQQQLDTETRGLWILDPLDGTTNFASGVPVFSVSVALIQNNEVVLGLIYDPNRDEVFSAIKGEGAWFNGKPLSCETERQRLKQCSAQIDFKRLSKSLRGHLCVEHPYASQRNFGSGALDWCWLVTARSQVYIHGGQKLWDYAAGQLILSEAGGVATTFEGEPMFIRSLEPRSVMAAVNQSLYNELKAYFDSVQNLDD